MPLRRDDFASLPFQRRNQAQIVQHGRAQQERDIANRVHARIGELSNVVQVSKTDGIIRLDSFCQIGSVHQHSIQGLPHLIVQFPRDGAPLDFLRIHQPG